MCSEVVEDEAAAIEKPRLQEGPRMLTELNLGGLYGY